MRIIVCGSRKFSNKDLLVSECVRVSTVRPVTWVHGGCPTGADALCDRLLSGEKEVHQADWNAHGRAAGPIRNEEMAKLGADLCLAFFERGEENRGTHDMVRRAKAHGIPVREFWSDGGTQ